MTLASVVAEAGVGGVLDGVYGENRKEKYEVMHDAENIILVIGAAGQFFKNKRKVLLR